MTLQEVIDQLKKCGYECEGGRLEDNVAFKELEAICQPGLVLPGGGGIAESQVKELGAVRWPKLISPFQVVEIVMRYWQATLLNLEVPNERELTADLLAGGILALTQVQELLRSGELTREKVEIFK